MIIFNIISKVITLIGILIIVIINVFCSFVKDCFLMTAYGIIQLFAKKDKEKTDEKEQEQS